MIQLQVETITACQATCVFCTYPGMKRKRGRMDAAVYRKVMTDAIEMGMFIDQVSLQGLGEPLMDKDLVPRIRMAREALPHAEISLFTNGSLLTVDMATRLKGAGLSYLVVSLTGSDTGERKAAMGLDDFEKVSGVVELVRNILPTRVKIITSRDLVTDMHAQAFQERWGKDAMVTWEGNWAGRSSPFRGVPHTVPCHRALDQLMVLWNGDVSLCCFDGEGEVLYGNVMEKSLADIWGSPERARVRELHKAGRRAELDLCRTCTGI